MNANDHDDLHDRGLAFDLSMLVARRQALFWMGGVGLATLVGCTSDDSPTVATTSSTPSVSSPTSATSATTTAAGTTAAAECGDEIAAETAGPFPGDGSNGPNALATSGIVRTDIRGSFGGPTGVAAGIPLTVGLQLQDAGNNCAALRNAAVYLWHCDRDGNYSMYSPAAVNENYLRGVQSSNAQGALTFTTVFPGAYSGRWPHMHFEVYESVAAATGGGRPLVTSQLALPEDVCNAAYATSGYEQSIANMQRTSLTNDNVFRDGVESQLATVTGTVSSGLFAKLSVPVG